MAVHPSGRSVLLVEDEEATTEALTLFLRDKGYRVFVAKNGQEALDYLRRSPLPDVILLDLPMSVMDAWEFRQKQLQDSALAAIPVVILCDASELTEQVNHLGDVGCVRKPIDTDVLLAAIHRFTIPNKPEVLVVEDEKAVLQMMDFALRHYGFAVRLAASGQEAIELYQRHYDTITLVLLDVQMPGLDGPGTLAALKEINPDVRSCFMSGHTGKYTDEDLLRMGAAHVFPKPFLSLSSFTQTLWDMVDPCLPKADSQE